MPIMLLTNPKIDGTRTNVPAILNALPRTNPTKYNVSGTIPIPPWSSLNPVSSTEWHYQGIAPYNGSGSTINDVEADGLNNLGVGMTLGYAVNENLNMTVGYKSTVNDSDPTDMRMDGFMFTMVYGWHPTIEGMRRLKSE